MNDSLLFEQCVGHIYLVLNESANGATKFRGKFQEANTPNKNRRKYPKRILEHSVANLMEQIDARGLFGELDHPTDSIVHLANASHLVTKLWWEEDCLMGEGEVLNTPSGKVLKSLVESGVRFGMSSRGVGSGQPDSEGVLVIGESFKLITFDAVADPSTNKAYQSKFKESFQPEIIKPKINHKALISYFDLALQQRLDESKKL